MEEKNVAIQVHGLRKHLRAAQNAQDLTRS